MPWGAWVFVPSPHRVLLLCRLFRKCKNSAETSGIAENERPIRDRKDTATEEPHVEPFPYRQDYAIETLVTPARGVRPGPCTRASLPISTRLYPFYPLDPQTLLPQAWEFHSPRLKPPPLLKRIWGVTKGSEHTSSRALSHYLHIRISMDVNFRTNLQNLLVDGPPPRQHLAPPGVPRQPGSVETPTESRRATGGRTAPPVHWVTDALN